MKKILTILFVFTSFFASAQKLDSIRGAGFIWERGMFNKSLGIPTVCGVPKTNYTDSTKKAQIIYDSCAGKFYAYNPATESWAEPGGAGSGVDSVTIVQTGCAFTFYTWQAGVSTAVGTLSQYNGLTPGTGLVTHTSGLTFTVTAAVYAIDCVTYVTRDTTITLPAAGDTGRIDVIKVNTSSVTTYGQGTEGEALPLPSLSYTELALTYILVTDTGVFVSPPAETPTWDYVGQNLTTHNPLSNVGIGGTPQGFKLQVFGNTALGVGNLNAETRFGPNIKIDYDGTGPRLFSSGRIGINGQSGLYIAGLGAVVDTTTYKPTVTDASGNVKRLSYWPGGSGGGGTPTWQQSLVTGSNLNQSNTIDGGDFPFYMQNLGYTFIESSYEAGSSASLILDGADGGDGSTLYNTNGASTSTFSANGDVAFIASSTSGLRHILEVRPLFIKADSNTDTDTTKFIIVNPPIKSNADYYAAFKNDTLVKVPFIRDSTIYFESPLEVYTSGDSNKIRINPDTLAAWRASGSYTPTATIVANVASTVPAKCFWIRVGNIVTVTGMVSISTDTIGVSEILLTTPISYVFQDGRDAAGVPISESLGAVDEPYILAKVDDDKIRLIFNTLSGSDAANISFTFSYEIL